MKIAVIGATGLLGSEICRQRPDCVGLSRPTIDLTNPETIRRALEESDAEVVINTAAYTEVDKAESEPKLCRAINTDGVRDLCEVCRELNLRLVHVSTDYVFCGNHDRTTPYREDNPTFVEGVYATSKLDAETIVKQLENHVIARVCGLYGQAGQGTPRANFVDTMLRLGADRDELKVINDQVSTPSYVPHVARAILFLAEHETTGIYHVVNNGQTSWHELAQEIFRLTDLSVNVLPISTEEWGAAAPRPRFSVLDVGKYEKLGGPPLPTWQEALAEYLATKQ